MIRFTFWQTLLCWGIAACWLGPQSVDARESGESGQATRRKVHVQVTRVVKYRFRDQLMIQSRVTARYRSDISAQVGGPLMNVFVREGDRVEKDKTLLFTIDAKRYELALEAAQRGVELAERSVKEREIALKNAQLQFEQAQRDFKRAQALLEGKAMPRQQFEHSEMAFKLAEVGVKHAQSLVSLAQAQLAQSRAQLKLAAKNLRDCRVTAPFSGVVSKRFLDPGANVGPGQPVVQLLSDSELEFEGYVPQESYSKVQAGKTRLLLPKLGEKGVELRIDFRDPVVDQGLRNFRVKAGIPAELVKQLSLAPGMEFQSILVFSERETVGIPRQAVVRRGTDDVVFTISQNRAKQIKVKTGLYDDRMVEVLTPALSEGALVVTVGQSFLEDGTEVVVDHADKGDVRP